uniref:SAM domain-containing protein n=1 Tax=Eptatretus burgeri TaxID=7764 RepID=A0A8C4QSI5_EPTBU
MSALLFVAREGSEKLLQRLLEYGVNLNQADCKGWTALFWAASRGHVSAVSILISAGADANHTDHVGSSLHAVILQEGHHKILSLLAPQSAMESNVPRRPQRTPNALQDGAARIRIKQGRTSVRRVTEKSAPQLVSFILKQLQENDLHDFLSGLQLAHLTLYFQAHRVSFHSLLSMTAQDLAKIGVLKMGEQQKILWAVENVHRKGWDPNCLPCKCTRSWWTTNQRK